MLFKCFCHASHEAKALRNKRFDERILSQTQWHPWFAWRPVAIGDGVCAWLQVIERRRDFRWPNIARDNYVRDREWYIGWMPWHYRITPNGSEK